MNKSKKGIIINLCLIIYGFIFQAIILNNFLKYSDYINVAFMSIMAYIAIKLYGFQKDKQTRTKKAIFFKIVLVVLLYFVVSYGISFLIGFNKNAYSTKLNMIFNNSFMPLLLIIFMEIYRYVIIGDVNKHGKNEKITTLALSVFEICIAFRFSSIRNGVLLFKTITTIVLPIISKNLILAKIVKYGGLRPTLFYRICMDLYIYFIPILPGYNDWMTSVLGVCYPILVYISMLKEIKYKENIVEGKFFAKESLAKSEALIVGIILFVALLSGIFPITLIGIGSDSMYPKIHKGDAIIYKKVYNIDRLEIGDVIVYYDETQNRTIVHRLVEKKEVNNQIVYKTKGDANNSIDSIDITEKDIKGKVLFKIRYVAYFSIWLSELLKRS